MKLRLRAFISLPYTGGRRSISEAVATKFERPFSNGYGSDYRSCAGLKHFVHSSSGRRISHIGTLDKFQFRMASGEQSPSFSRYGILRVQNLKCSVHSSSSGDDDFSELGLPVQGGGLRSKLVTEMPKASLNANHSIRAAFGMPLPGKNNSSLKGSPLKQDKHTVRFNVENSNGASRTKFNTENAPNLKNQSSIIIEKVPHTISLLQLRQAASVFGEILNASLTKGSNGLNSCHIEFQRMESRERAVATGGITVMSFRLQIRGLPSLENITIRVTNINVKTAEPSIHSICLSCGRVEGLLKTKDDSVDVIFGVQDISARQGILKKLNDVFIDNCQWSAQLLVRTTPPNVMINTPNVKSGVESKISCRLEDLRKQLDMKSIYLEDLEELHHAIVHLQDHPSAIR